MGNSAGKDSLESSSTVSSKDSLESSATVSSCRHLLQLLRSSSSPIQTAALSSLREITANSTLRSALMSGRDNISSLAAAILFPAIVRLLHDFHVLPIANISLSLDILLNLSGCLDDKCFKTVYGATGLAPLLDSIELIPRDLPVEVHISIRLLKLSGFEADRDSIPDLSEQSRLKESSMKRNYSRIETARYGHPGISKFKFQPALIEANIGKWLRIMTILEDFVFYGMLASADTMMGKFSVTKTAQFIKMKKGRNWDFKNRKSLQIFFFDDCRTVEVVSEERVKNDLAPWSDEDVDEETRRENDNMLKPWSKNKNDVSNKLSMCNDGEENRKEQNLEENVLELEDNENMLEIVDNENVLENVYNVNMLAV